MYVCLGRILDVGAGELGIVLSDNPNGLLIRFSSASILILCCHGSGPPGSVQPGRGGTNIKGRDSIG
jgi:hypothetical protein